jgi:rod shape-determining protein MreB and related proteins
VRWGRWFGRGVPFLSLLPAPRGHDLAIDLGTANTVVYRRGEGVVAFEPSVVAIDERTEAVVAIGQEARRMIGRTPASIRAIRPLRHGVIADFEVTEQMLRYFIRRGREGWFGSPRVVLCVPSGVTEVERRAVVEAAVGAGARRAYLIEEPMAGAIGAGLPVGEAAGSMVVDIGGGTSEVAVISLGGMVVSRSLRVGGYELDEAIVRHLREQGLVVGQERAEEVKIEIGAALVGERAVGGEAAGGPETEVAGRDLVTGLLRRRTITAAEVGRAIERPVAQIVEAVMATLEQTPPELSADLSERGLVLVGGGALLGGIAERLRRETRLPVHVADSPLTCVAIGAGRSLEELPTYEKTAPSRSARRPGRRSRLSGGGSHGPEG